MDDKYLDLMATEVETAKTLPLVSAGQPGSSPKPPNAESSALDQPQSYFLRKAEMIAACYRRDDAHDPAMYAAAVAAVLSTYPQSVVEYVSDPRTGIAGICKWLPSVAEIREFCDNQIGRQARHHERDERIARQLADRDTDTAPRVDLSKFKDADGNWVHSDDERTIASGHKRAYTEAEKQAFLDDARATGFEFNISGLKLRMETLRAMQEKDKLRDDLTN
jgi:hypothetical protein